MIALYFNLYKCKSYYFKVPAQVNMLFALLSIWFQIVDRVLELYTFLILLTIINNAFNYLKTFRFI